MTLMERIARDFLNPSTGVGAVFYAILFLFIASLLATMLRRIVNNLLQHDRNLHIDRTYALFLTQLFQAVIYVAFLILYAHLIPELHSIATALLAGVSVISVVLGLAAQNTLGNLVAGIAVLLYRPFHIGDTIQVAAPRGSETGIVESITLGYTVLITSDNRRVMVPNSAVMSQTTVNLTHVNLPPS